LTTDDQAPAVVLEGDGIAEPQLHSFGLGRRAGRFSALPSASSTKGGIGPRSAARAGQEPAAQDPAAQTAFDVRQLQEEQLDLKARPDLMARNRASTGGAALEALRPATLRRRWPSGSKPIGRKQFAACRPGPLVGIDRDLFPLGRHLGLAPPRWTGVGRTHAAGNPFWGFRSFAVHRLAGCRRGRRRILETISNNPARYIRRRLVRDGNIWLLFPRQCATMTATDHLEKKCFD